MAILDADKEGFLRSDRSLIQTIGRAARNVNGTVILYADSMTDSMKRAMDETERRRRLQRAFNEKHGITPQSIVKALGSPLIKIYDADYVDLPMAAEKPANYRASELPRVIQKLQKEMRQAAERLEFEKAAELRDRIRVLGDSRSGAARCRFGPQRRRRSSVARLRVLRVGGAGDVDGDFDGIAVPPRSIINCQHPAPVRVNLRSCINILLVNSKSPARISNMLGASHRS